MRKLKSILLATDFRPASRSAAEVAVRLASVSGAHVNMLHVLEPLPQSQSAFLRMNRDHAVKKLKALAEQLVQQNAVIDETLIDVGHTADVISREADATVADLIVIGAGERSQHDHFVLGPNAAAIMQHARKPVLAIRPGEAAAEFRKILCPVDMSPASTRGLLNAIQLSHAFDGQLIVLTVVPTPGWFALAADARSFGQSIEQHARQWRDDFEQFLLIAPLGSISWEKELRTGTPHEQIVAAARERHADLIVMGSTGRSGLARILMGSVTRRVIQHLPCSLLTVKPEELSDDEFNSNLDTMRMLYAEGCELLAAKSYDAALAKFEQVLARDPYHATAMQGRADAFEQLGYAEDAAHNRNRASAIEQSEPKEYELGGGD
jgi:nucleotide-binding universal stress UspA family protein